MCDGEAEWKMGIYEIKYHNKKKNKAQKDLHLSIIHIWIIHKALWKKLMLMKYTKESKLI
mgnify:CR=1 FL=1